MPLKGRDLKLQGQAFRFAGNTFRVFHSRPLPEGKIKDGTSFSCDARGHWFLNIVVEVAAPEPRPVRCGIGIDLGLKDFAALSTGDKIENPRYLRQLADKLAIAQRARKRRQATTFTPVSPMPAVTFTINARLSSFESSIILRSAT